MQKIARSLAALAALAAACGPVLGAEKVELSDPARTAALLAELRPPPVPGVRVVEVAATTATIEWPAALSDASRFRVEARRLFLDADRALALRWEEFPTASIARRGEVVRARLRGLQPQQPHWLRVLPQRDAGAPGEPLFALRFDTPARPQRFTPKRLILGGLGLLLAGLGWLRWRRGRGS